MRAHSLCIVLLACLPLGAALQEDSDVKDGMDAIDQKSIQADIHELAADSYMGRSCPTPGYMRAAEFVEARFKQLGLTPGGSNPEGEHPYFRYFEHEATVLGDACELAFSSGDGTQQYEVEKDWIPLAGAREGSVEGELVFVGYAIQAPKSRYKDIGSIDLKDKLAIAFWHEPRENKKDKRFDGLEWTKHSSALEKAKLAEAEGALGLILIQDPHHEPSDRPPLFQFPRFAGASGRPADKPCDFPVAFVSLDVGEALTGLDLRAEHASIDKSLKCKPQLLEGRKAKLAIQFESKRVRVPNVVGVVQGRDNSDKSVVVAAHLDHVGADDGGQIWNGADDNASGTSAMLAVAAAFAAAPAKRDTILIAMAAEEWGLWGSEAYTRDPLITMESTEFMMNIDMVGRGDTKEIAVMGAWDSKDLQKLVKSAAKLVGTKLKLDMSGGRQYWHRSDQLHFFKKGVPALFVSEVGIEHVDYHQPSDTVDKIDTKKATYAAKLAYAITWSIGNLDEPLERLPND